MQTPENAEYRSPRTRQDAAQELSRLVVDTMTPVELDLACAILLGKDVRVAQGSIQTRVDDSWARWSVTSDWAAYGELTSNVELVSGSHARYDDPSDLEKVTGHWYSCHSYFGETKTEGFDLREVVARCAAKRLMHNLKYSTIA